MQIPYDERPTLVIDSGDVGDRPTLTSLPGEAAEPKVQRWLLCTVCSYLNDTGEETCNHCFSPLPQRAPSATELLQVTVGQDPRFGEAPRRQRAAGARPVRLSLLHVALTDAQGDPLEDRDEAEAIIAAWKERVEAMGGVICLDDGSTLRALFGLDGDWDPARACVVAALALERSLADVESVRHQSGAATGAVWMDAWARATPAQGIRGSAVDLATRLATFAGEGRLVACEETVRAFGQELSTGRSRTIEARGTGRKLRIVEVLQPSHAARPAVPPPSARRIAAPPGSRIRLQA
jgi:class 3 adenylate cyclase